MKTHNEVVSDIAEKLQQPEEQVRSIVTAYIQGMQQSGWNLIRAGLRLRVMPLSGLVLENTVSTPWPR